MKQVTILDKTFGKSIENARIEEAINSIADSMNAELKDSNPLFLCVLNGSFMFTGSLMKRLEFPCQISFVKLSSYKGTDSSLEVKQLIGLTEDVKGRTVVVLEDIVDTGLTAKELCKYLHKQGAEDVKLASMLLKPEALKHEVRIDYKGLEIPNEFIVGYGLDYDGYGRNLSDIYTLIQ